MQHGHVHPEIAKYVRHYDSRMSSSIPEVRLKVLTELTYFHQRDSKFYPSFLQLLLNDPSPAIRWQALARLDEHGITVSDTDLPVSVAVPMGGLLDRTSQDSIQRFRKQAASMEPEGGWAVRALGLMHDTQSRALALSLLESDNVFVRYSAACTLINLGEVEHGLQALRSITTAADDDSGCYRLCAAERLWRLGEKEHIEVIFDLYETRASYADGADGILEDLTGEYFITENEWRQWWNDTGKAKYLGIGR